MVYPVENQNDIIEIFLVTFWDQASDLFRDPLRHFSDSLGCLFGIIWELWDTLGS